MKPTVFVKCLKAVIIGTTLIGLACFVYVIPSLMEVFISQYPEFSYWVLPWKVLMYVCALPCFVAMPICWKIAQNIKNDNSFCIENATLFKIFSYLALGDSLVYMIGSFTLFFMGMNHPGLLIGDMMVVFVGFAVFVCTSALSYLVAQAANLQEDSDLTI